VAVQPGGDLVLGGLPEPFLEVLKEVPAILDLASSRKDAASRIYPDPYDDEAANESWRRHARPEIAALFASARELVEGDLSQSGREATSRRAWKVPISAAHHAAWISALNAARLVLGVVHRVTAEDMDRLRESPPASERDVAILKIHLLGWAQELLVAAAPGR
ncbi:MAG TPA: DUF2017 family protein, partial [Planctomycetota bacterium]|nr:DUF2017 family protein [Planctomycetota bacterium]